MIFFECNSTTTLLNGIMAIINPNIKPNKLGYHCINETKKKTKKKTPNQLKFDDGASL